MAKAGEAETFHVANLGNYKQTGYLGRGSFGVVIRAVDISTRSRHEVAIKLLPRGDHIAQFRLYVEREILHQGSLKHPFIVALKEVFLTPKHIAIVMEYARGGDLLRYTLKHYPSFHQEDHARWIFQQLIIGLDYCHQMGVANRDLKLENLLTDQDTDGKRPLLKICDFGYSKHEMNSSAKSGVGSPVFMAPEIVFSGNRYDAKTADLWSCGVILYSQIYGRYPFDVKEKDYAKKFYNAEYPLPKEVPASPQCIDLLKKLLISKPDQRLGIDGIMKHPWFLMELPEGALEMNKHYLAKAPKYTEELKAQLEEMVGRGGKVGHPDDEVVTVSFLQRR